MSNPNGTIGEHPLDDLAAYALDALDDAERQAVDDHLERCPECRSELAGHHETLAALGTTSEEAPPAAVWERVAAGIGAPGLADPHRGGPSGPAPAAPAPAPAAPVRPVEPRRAEASSTGDGGTVTSLSMSRAPRDRGARPSGVRWLAVAAAGLVVAAMTGGAVGYLVGTSSDDDADIGTLAERAGEDPEGVLATLDDSGGRPVARVVGDDDGAYLVLEGLQDLPEGRAYQLWSLTGPEPVSLGMLGRDGNNTVAFRLPPTITELAISEEPTIGEAAPTGQFEASGSIIRQATPS
jgi:anti-sigma-K factor RskA